MEYQQERRPTKSMRADEVRGGGNYKTCCFRVIFPRSSPADFLTVPLCHCFHVFSRFLRSSTLESIIEMPTVIYIWCSRWQSGMLHV